jgi:hypothetical protein
MKPYINQAYFEPNVVEKLFKKIPEKNFLVDVNNLLAKETLDTLSPDQILLLGDKYQIKDASKKYKSELLKMITLFLIEHLGNWGSDVNDYKSAKKLQNILGIPENDFYKEYVALASRIMVDQVLEILTNSKKFQIQEITQIEKLRQTLEIPVDNANHIIEEVKKKIVQDCMDNMISDKKVSPLEMESFELLCKDIDVTVKMDDKTRVELEKYKRLWIIDEGDLPLYESDIILQKNELCHYRVNAKLFENRKITKRVSYAGNTFRLKIAKGWYYRVGDVGVARQTEDIMSLIDEGVLYITNKRILFNGSKNNKAIRYNQIIDLNPYSDGVEIVKETGKSPTFQIDNQDGDALTATIARIIRDNQ